MTCHNQGGEVGKPYQPNLDVGFNTNQESRGTGLATSLGVQFDINRGGASKGAINVDGANQGICIVKIDQGYRIDDVKAFYLAAGTHPPGTQDAFAIDPHPLSFETVEIRISARNSVTQGNATYQFNVEYSKVQ
jgi:hypothetical protein